MMTYGLIFLNLDCNSPHNNKIRAVLSAGSIAPFVIRSPFYRRLPLIKIFIFGSFTL